MVFAFSLGDAQALDWRLEPSVSATSIYTDNVDQRQSNTSDALILSVTPGFTLRSEGSRRVQASLSYRLTGTSRFSNDNSNDIFHSLGALGKAEIVEDLFFIDGSANVGKNLISLFGSPADASVNAANRATTGVYTISPYLVQRLGTFAQAQVRYSRGGAIFGDNAAQDTDSGSFTASLSSGTRFDDLSWGLNYSLSETRNRDGGPDHTFERATLSAGYVLTRKVRVFATYGHDWNEYLSAANVGGGSYSVGVGWAPNARTSLEVSAGERYFGNTYSVSGTYRTRASNWSVRYHEDVSDISQQLQIEGGRIFWVCAGRLFETRNFTPPPGQTACLGPLPGQLVTNFYAQLGLTEADLIPFGLRNISLDNGVFVSKNLNIGWSWSPGARTTLGVSVFDTRRIFQAVSHAEDHSRGIVNTLSYRMTRHTTASGSIGLTRNSATTALLTTGNRDDDSLSLNLGMSHQFGKDLSGALSFRHQQRDSSTGNNDFTENSLSATVNKRF